MRRLQDEAGRSIRKSPVQSEMRKPEPDAYGKAARGERTAQRIVRLDRPEHPAAAVHEEEQRQFGARRGVTGGQITALGSQGEAHEVHDRTDLGQLPVLEPEQALVGGQQHLTGLGVPGEGVDVGDGGHWGGKKEKEKGKREAFQGFRGGQG